MTRLNVITLISIFLFFWSTVIIARDTSTKELQKSGRLNIPFEECNKIENELGQLFYVNADGYNSAHTIDPEYIDMVNDLQIGGVLPHPNVFEYNDLKKNFGKLQMATTAPLLIGVDYLGVALNIETGSYKHFGMGYGRGFMGKYGNVSPQCINDVAFLDALHHRAVGLNHALGPTVEKSLNPRSMSFLGLNSDKVAPQAARVMAQFDELGVATTMKHFPYTPETYNLHRKTEDNLLPEPEVLKNLDIYKDLANKTDFAMTTHLFNSNIDPDDMATFSKKWVGMLRKNAGFDGILMTDGLFMIRHYDETVKKMSAKWPQNEVEVENVSSIFAARALLAGHDMVFLEGTAANTYRTFNDLLFIACQDKPVGKELRSRIQESYTKISSWKKIHMDHLKQNVDIPEDLFAKAMQLYKSDKICDRHKEVEEVRKTVAALKILPRNQSTQSNRKTEATQ